MDPFTIFFYSLCALLLFLSFAIFFFGCCCCYSTLFTLAFFSLLFGLQLLLLLLIVLHVCLYTLWRWKIVRASPFSLPILYVNRPIITFLFRAISYLFHACWFSFCFFFCCENDVCPKIIWNVFLNAIWNGADENNDEKPKMHRSNLVHYVIHIVQFLFVAF